MRRAALTLLVVLAVFVLPLAALASPGDGSLAVVVDNTIGVDNASLPHYGLWWADIVFEAAIAPGTTRFLALYSDFGARVVGPVRSLRPQLLSLAQAFSAPVAHAGGSAEALKEIRETGYPSIDEINGWGGYFWRDASRRAPHNLFTRLDLVYSAGLPLGKTTHLPLGTMPGGEKATRVRVGFPSYWADPAEREFRYDSRSGLYTRYMELAYKGLSVHYSGGLPIRPANVVVMRVPYVCRMGEDGCWSWVADVTGRGPAEFYTAGRKWEGEWVRSDRTSRLVFQMPDGKPMYFRRGQTWVLLVPSRPLVYGPPAAQVAVEKAMDLLEWKAPQHYDFLCRNVVAVDVRNVVDGYNYASHGWGGIVVLSENWGWEGEWTPYSLAGVLVHEATHVDQGRTHRYLSVLKGGLTSTALGPYAEVEACDREIDALLEVGVPQSVLYGAEWYRQQHAQSTAYQVGETIRNAAATLSEGILELLK